MTLDERIAQIAARTPVSLDTKVQGSRDPRLVTAGDVTILGSAGKGRLVGGANVTVAGDARHGYAICATCRKPAEAGTNLPLPSLPTGACCIGGECSVTTEGACLNAGGTYQGDNTPCDPNPCEEAVTCCADGVLVVPLTNMFYTASVSGSVVVSPCDTNYTLSGSFADDLPLSSDCFPFPESYSTGISNIVWDFDTDPGGTADPDCSAQFAIGLSCDPDTGGWTWQAVVTSSASAGLCSGLCGGGSTILWGGGDSGPLSLGADPTGTHSVDIPDLSIGGITWHFDIVVS